MRRYLIAALGEDAAADVTQEFALALVEGKFRGADPQRGGFRDYLKSVLFHLVSQYRRRNKKQATVSVPLDERAAVPVDQSELQFKESWRDELLARAWAGLVDVHPDFFTVLHCRAVHPDFSAQQLVAELNPQLGRELSIDNMRQILHRARKAYANLLLADVAQTLKHPTVDAVQDELRDLDLLPYFKARRTGAPPIPAKV